MPQQGRACRSATAPQAAKSSVVSPHHVVVRRAIVVQEPVRRACAQVRHLIMRSHCRWIRLRKRACGRIPLGRGGTTHDVALWQGHIARRRPRAAAPGAGGVRAAVPGAVAAPPAPAAQSATHGALGWNAKARGPQGGTCVRTGTAHLLLSASKNAALLIAAGEPGPSAALCEVACRRRLRGGSHPPEVCLTLRRSRYVAR